MKRSTIISEIKLLALDLNIGHSLRAVCPFCHADHETSFTVTRIPEGLLYNCYRSGCNVDNHSSGFIGTIPSELYKKMNTKTVKVFKPKPFTYPTTLLPDDIREELFEKYEFTPICKWEPLNQRLVFEALNYEGWRFGHVAKDWRGTFGVKSVNYFENDGSHLHYIRAKGGFLKGAVTQMAVVVEDIISAQKVADVGVKLEPGDAAIAILGNHLNAAQAGEIRQQGFKNLVVMLDPNAKKESKRIADNYRLYFETVHEVFLEADPKDTPFGMLRTELDGTKANIRSLEQARALRGTATPKNC